MYSTLKPAASSSEQSCNDGGEMGMGLLEFLNHCTAACHGTIQFLFPIMYVHSCF